KEAAVEDKKRQEAAVEDKKKEDDLLAGGNDEEEKMEISAQQEEQLLREDEPRVSDDIGRRQMIAALASASILEGAKARSDQSIEELKMSNEQLLSRMDHLIGQMERCEEEREQAMTNAASLKKLVIEKNRRIERAETAAAA
ncbi:hypothetical protein PMAYCL1PPCAC_10065, partial [Pristionchus mayeri]